MSLAIEDDGLGFDAGKLADLGGLEAEGHFGLAGMQERAALIGAYLQFNTIPEHGTRVEIRWQPNQD